MCPVHFSCYCSNELKSPPETKPIRGNSISTDLLAACACGMVFLVHVALPRPLEEPWDLPVDFGVFHCFYR